MLGANTRFIAQVNKDSAKKEKRDNECSEIFSKIQHRYSFFEAEHTTRNKYHKMFIEKWYLVLYWIQDDIVYVDYILDCRKEYS